MPLRDHFKPPLTDELKFDGFSSAWASELARWLNRTLPAGEYRAIPETRLGAQVEADVAEYARHGGGDGVHAAATLPAPATVEAVYPDVFEVEVKETFGSRTLVGVIELVSPGNKKERAEREAFVAKCVAYLRQGIGLVVVDVVTERLVNFHNDLMAAVGGPTAPRLADKLPTYVSSYRPTRRGTRNELDVWSLPATVGQPLPKVPFCLRGGPRLDLDLDGTYTQVMTDFNLA